MKKVYFILLPIGFSSVLLGDNGATDELAAALGEATRIATVANMNADYVPSVISVRKSSELRDAGALNVYDALSLLPGVQMYLNQYGDAVSVVRGFRNPNNYIADKVRVMIDGVVVNSETYGAASFVMDMPLDIVDRIEVLRGPGSTLYGSGAFYGAVNIVTKSASSKKTSNELFAGYGSHYYTKAGAFVSSHTDGVGYSADGYYQSMDRRVAVDKSYTDAGGNFPRAYETVEGFYDFSVGFNASFEKFSVNSRFKKSSQGNYYGLEERLEPRDDTAHVKQLFFSEAAYDDRLGAGSLELKAGVMDYAYQMNAVARDSSYLYGALPGFNYDYSYKSKIGETKVYTSGIYRFDKLGGHLASIGGELSYVGIRENYFWAGLEDYAFASNNARLSTQPAMKSPQNYKLIKDNAKRSLFAVFVEDVYEITDDVDAVAGIRVDKNSDLKMQISSRVGVAARWLNSSLVTKAICSMGHRAPSFYEKGANAHIGFRAGDDFLKPEDIRSYEIAAVYKPSGAHNLSLNAYYSELNNVIDVEEIYETPQGSANYPKRLSKGFEAEYAFKPNKMHEFRANYSVNKTTYLNVGNMELQDMPDVSPSMYKAWYVYRPTNDLTLGAKYTLYSKTIQNQDFTNKDTTVAPNHSLDLSFRYKVFEGEAALFVNNALDKTIRMPSYYYRNFQGRNDGMIRDGRSFAAEFRRKF